MAFGAPAPHAAGEIGDIAKPSLAQDHGGLCRAAAGAADRDNRAVARELAGAIGQLGEWNELGTANMPERPLELPRFANIEDLNLAGMLFEAVRIDLPDPGKGIFERRPGWTSVATGSVSGRPHLRLAGTATSIFFGWASRRFFI